MKILLAVDGSPYTKKMLAYLATHAEMFGTNNQFTLLNVQMPLPPRARAAVGAEVVKSYHDEEAANKQLLVLRNRDANASFNVELTAKLARECENLGITYCYKDEYIEAQNKLNKEQERLLREFAKARGEKDGDVTIKGHHEGLFAKFRDAFHR